MTMIPSRRTLLLAASSVALMTPLRLLAQPRFQKDPFTLGVASGYPQPDGIVLWTRLAPDPLDGGGMPDVAVAVRWEIAADDGFRKIIRSGSAMATPQYGHSVHAEINGLEPAREYWYRFHAGSATSAVGRIRTAPPADAIPASLRFTLASCQNYEHGLFTAYRHMAAEFPNLVVHVGDYIYESATKNRPVRQHHMAEPFDLVGYRNRYGIYKSDRDLQAAHAACPWLVTWDDHEVANDYANDRSQHLDPVDEFLKRRAAAYQAFYEHMPLPRWARPKGPVMQLYSRATYGQLAQFHILDGRQYRSYQVCPPPGRGGINWVTRQNCPALDDPARTYLGQEQESWFRQAMQSTRSRWNLITQPTLMASSARQGATGVEYRTDGWDGYPAARARLLKDLTDHKPANPVVLGGDVHMAIVADLNANTENRNAPAIASEFVCASISSRGPSRKRTEQIKQDHPHIHFADGTMHGYTSFELSAQQLTARLRVVANVNAANAPIRDAATYVVANGRAGPQKA